MTGKSIHASIDYKYIFLSLLQTGSMYVSKWTFYLGFFADELGC